MKVTVVITRKEGEALSFRIPEEKLDLRLVEGWLIVNEKTGSLETVQTPQGPMNIEKARTLAVLPNWNVLDCQVSGAPAGFTTA